jgi:hypothetical protein
MGGGTERRTNGRTDGKTDIDTDSICCGLSNWLRFILKQILQNTFFRI